MTLARRLPRSYRPLVFAGLLLLAIAAPALSKPPTLSVFGSTGIGSVATFELKGVPAQPSGILVSLGFLDPPLHVPGGLGGDLALDLQAPWFMIPLPLIPGSGTLDVPIGIPNDPLLLGIALHLQAFAPSLTNEVSIALHASDTSISLNVPNERLGSGVVAGDFDGDGLMDVASTAILGDNGAGAVRLFHGTPSGAAPSGLVPYAIVKDPTPQANANFGSVILAADLTGDGKDDLVVAAPYAGPVVQDDSGEVFLIDGATLQPFGAFTDPSTASGTGYGTGVALGDFDLDGAIDLAVGAPGTKLGGLPLAGEVYVHRGGAFASTLALHAPQIKPSAVFGAVLAAADQNLDGFCDLLACAPAAPQGSIFGAGEAWLFRGPLTAPPTGYFDPAPTPASAFACRAAFGDITGGPALDIVLGTPGGHGSPLGNPDHVSQVGEIEVYVDGAPSQPRILDDPTPEYFQHYGMDVKVADVDGDGHLDVVASAFLADQPGLVDAGEVFVYRGPALKEVYEFSAASPQAGQQFGVFVEAVDLDHDGAAELVIGAPYESPVGATFAGALHVVHWH